MKARLFSLLAMVLCLASCQKDVDDMNVNMGGDVATINVVLPEDAITRAAATETDSAWSGLKNEASEQVRVTLYIFDENGMPSAEPYVQTLEENQLTANFDVRLIPNRDYTFVAWAGQVDAESNFDLTTTAKEQWEIKLNDWAAMDESRDAFTGKLVVEDFNSVKTIPTLQLTRPFAKLRVVTTDMEWINNINVTPAYAEVSYEVALPASFNAYTQTIGTEAVAAKEHKVFAIKDYTKDATDTTGEMTLFTDYILVPESGVVKFILDVYEDASKAKLIESTAFMTDIPVKRNNLTTIKGDVLTDGNNITVEVKPEFEGEITPEAKWDGDAKMPKHNGSNPDDISDATEIYVEAGSELAWLADAVNGTTRAAANTFKGVTIMLNQSIDLNGEEWTPIGSSNNPFHGTFDGKGNTIYNLVVRGGNNSDQGLFGYTTNGEIKNLVVENAKVSGRVGVGVVAGSPYTSKFTNITVKGHVEVKGMAYVGGVGGRNAYANWENITVKADETSYIDAYSIENGSAYRTYVGGVVGFNGEGSHSFKNITSNIDVKGSTCDVGGLFGIAHYSNNFENCSCSGDVEIYAAEESAEAEEIGGIAGVWMDSKTGAVTFTNIEFTGKVTTNIARETVWYDNVIGAPYNRTAANGTLIVDGVEMSKLVKHAASGLYYNGNDKPYQSVFYILNAEDLKKAASYFVHQTHTNEGNMVTFELGADIDLEGQTWEAWDVMWITFNGNNHTISNLKTTESWRAGLFSYIGASKVNDLTLKNITSTGAQAGILAGAVEGVTTNNVKIEGNNYVTYQPYASETYTETWGGVGAVTGVLTNSTINAEIVAGATVTVDTNGIVTNCGDVKSPLTGYLNANNGTVTNNGTVDFKISVAEDIEFDELSNLTSSGCNVTFTGDIDGEAATKAPYGNFYGIKQDGGVIDGNGNELDIECNGDHYGIMTSGGTIKNLTIKNGCRAVMIMYPQTAHLLST